MHLTDLSPSACYLETKDTLPVGSVLEVEFHCDELRVRCVAIVRLLHPQSGMGLEFTPSGSDGEGGLLLLIDLLITSGKAARLKARVRHPPKIPGHLSHFQRPGISAVEDCLLALILRPDSVNRKEFLVELARQRAHPPTR
jgi:hypothetical protein